MVAFAEQFVYSEQQTEFAYPPVVDAASMAEDERSRHQAERLIDFAGHMSVSQAVDCEASRPQRPKSLMEAIHLAAEGDEESRNLVTINARTDVIERTIKSGHILKVALEVDEDYDIWQYGQTMEEVQANTLRYASDNPKMRPRSEAEARNSYRIKNLNQQGWLEDYYFVVFSRAADDMSHSEMDEAGFFTDTMSMAIQATTAEGSGLTTETGFVAGVSKPGERRRDAEMVAYAGSKLGLDLSNKSAVETLDNPVLIHKSLMPNGVADLVELLDEPYGTFFGEEKSKQDYVSYKEVCKQREATYESKVQAIVGDLIASASSIQTPIDAVNRLHKISEKHMVQKALVDKSIDPRVFGNTAARHIEAARWHIERGDFDQAQASSQNAVKTARSSSCPSGVKSGNSSAEIGQSGRNQESAGEVRTCEFTSRECPECHKKNVKTISKKINGKTYVRGSCGCKRVYNN